LIDLKCKKTENVKKNNTEQTFDKITHCYK